MKPGIYYGLPEAEYHEDPCERPSLSSSIAKTIIDQSPAHARVAHPRLNPDYEPEQRAMFDRGSACHDLILRGETNIVEIDADDFRSKAAREARDQAYAEGKTPLLPKDAAPLFDMRDAFYRQIEAVCELSSEIAEAWASWRPEVTMIWGRDIPGAGPVTCRSRADILPANGPLLLDFKTTSGSAHAAAWASNQLYSGPDIQEAHYVAGARANGLAKERMLFIVQEQKPPFALSIVGTSPLGRETSRDRYEIAVRTWARCLATGSWPGFPAFPYYSDPSWASEKRRGMREELAEMTGRDALETAIRMQSPLENAR